MHSSKKFLDSNGDEISDAGNTDGESFSSIDDLLFDAPDHSYVATGLSSLKFG